MSTFSSSDRCTDLILDFIAGGVAGNPSGESAGNYSAFFGSTSGSKEGFASRSLKDIFAFQSEMLKKDPRSTAIGRYQFLRTTLRQLVAKHGLSETALFTDKLQDALAVDLLVGRGYSLWWRGRISDQEFAHLLSCEWASLPDPENGGRSHYDGDSAGNHASTSLPRVYAMLKAARSLKPLPGG